MSDDGASRNDDLPQEQDEGEPRLRLVEPSPPPVDWDANDAQADEHDRRADARDVEAAKRDLVQAIETELHGGDDDGKHRANRHGSMLDRQASERDRRRGADDRRRAADERADK
jgi:hypothetical protein